MAAEDVIDPFAGAGLLKADDVLGLLDDAHQALIAPLVGTDVTDVIFGKVVAGFAAFDFCLYVADSLCQTHSLFGVSL